MTEPTPIPLREAYNTFYRREYPKMVALAAAISGSRATAEDLAQEAMLRAHRNWDRVADYERPGAWVRRVTINLATSFTRRRVAESRRLFRLAPPSSLPEPDPPDEAVWRAVAALPDQQRAAVALHYLEDRPVAYIAEVLDISAATARVHLHRGRNTLAAVLDPEGARS